MWISAKKSILVITDIEFYFKKYKIDMFEVIIICICSVAQPTKGGGALDYYLNKILGRVRGNLVYLVEHFPSCTIFPFDVQNLNKLYIYW